LRGFKYPRDAPPYQIHYIRRERMDEKTMKQMAKLVDAVQPHCDEEIVAAMTCSHAGSMRSVVVPRLLGGLLGRSRPSTLPNPVFIAVGSNSIYAFQYSPRGFGYKIKKEVARWPKDEVSVQVEKSRTMAKFALTTASGETHSLEVATIMGAEQLVDAFLKVVGDLFRVTIKPRCGSGSHRRVELLASHSG